MTKLEEPGGGYKWKAFLRPTKVPPSTVLPLSFLWLPFTVLSSPFTAVLPTKAGGDITITAISGAMKATIAHVTFGDGARRPACSRHLNLQPHSAPDTSRARRTVWYCSGQSNMALPLIHTMSRNKSLAAIAAGATPFYLLSTAFPLPFLDLPPPIHCPSLTFHRLFTALPRPSTAFSLPFHCLQASTPTCASTEWPAT